MTKSEVFKLIDDICKPKTEIIDLILKFNILVDTLDLYTTKFTKNYDKLFINSYITTNINNYLENDKYHSMMLTSDNYNSLLKDLYRKGFNIFKSYKHKNLYYVNNRNNGDNENWYRVKDYDLFYENFHGYEIIKINCNKNLLNKLDRLEELLDV